MKAQQIFLFLLTSFVFKFSVAQEDPPPGYLTLQSFPDSALNVVLTDLEGNDVTFKKLLEENKGNYIILDFWASWCSDCIEGLPYLKNLQQKTSEKKVVFLMLSVDKDLKRWKAAIDKYDISGKHYNFVMNWKNPLSNYVGLDWIPRYIVLNDKGQVIEPKVVKANDNRLWKAVKNSDTPLDEKR